MLEQVLRDERSMIYPLDHATGAEVSKKCLFKYIRATGKVGANSPRTHRIGTQLERGDMKQLLTTTTGKAGKGRRNK